MNETEFQAVGLYNHNIESYKKIKEAFQSGEKVVGIVHATGTGKTYNALQLAYDNPTKKIIYVVPSNGIIEHVKEIIFNNPNLDFKRDFPNLEFRTYQSFLPLSEEEIASIECDLLILDEFHHIGAPVWGARINTMIDEHPDMRIFGMTAYTIRDRGTPYERDMANPDTNELFSGKIVSRYDLCDAMLDGVLPMPIYISAFIHLEKTIKIVEERVQKLNSSTKKHQELMGILNYVKRRIHEAPSISDILKKYIKPNGKYIYFCPLCSEEGANDIGTIKKQAKEWFCQFIKEEDIVFYTSTSDMGEAGKRNREAFYHDVTLEGEVVDHKFRMMFAINQYNEGIHAPNLDGVIMGRGTTSDIVFFEQLGRAEAVRGNTKETFDQLQNYSVQELLEMCRQKDIFVKEGSSKIELIEKLIAPIIIDLTNNYSFIKELENNLKDRIRERQASGSAYYKNTIFSDALFDIEVANMDLFEMLRYVMDRVTMTWEEKYEYAKLYYEHHNHLEVPSNFKTNDGYTEDVNGLVHLGHWILGQRKTLDPESERGKLLSQIGMRFGNIRNVMPWKEMYEYAKIYYEHHHNLDVPTLFKTNDGYTEDPNGTIRLGFWIGRQRRNLEPESEKGRLLSQIGMKFESKRVFLPWEEMYPYAKIYYEHHHHLEVPKSFKTDDGFTRAKNGRIHLGSWLCIKRRNLDPESEEGKLLSQIGMKFEKKRNILSWEEMYSYAKIYYEHYHNLDVDLDFKTNDGFTEDKNGRIHLGSWVSTQRKVSKESERGKLLSQIGMIWNKLDEKWLFMYGYAKIYYEHHHHLNMSTTFQTNDGFTEDPEGSIHLGLWIGVQRRKVSQESERGKLLSQIGMKFGKKFTRFSWEKMYEFAKLYYEHHHHLKISQNFKTNDGYTADPEGIIYLGSWISTQRRHTDIESEHGKLLSEIGMNWEKRVVTEETGPQFVKKKK